MCFQFEKESEIKKRWREIKKDYLFLRKIAFRIGWKLALLNYKKYSKIRKSLEFLCNLHIRGEEYEEWLKKKGLYTSIKELKLFIYTFNKREPMDYNRFLNKLFREGEKNVRK